MKKIIFYFGLSLFIKTSLSQVAINNGGNTPAASSMLDISSSNKGVLLPRMTSNQRKAIPDPETGLLVYDTDRQTIYLFDGENWKPMMVTVNSLLPLVSRKPEAIAGSASFGTAVDIYGNYAVVGAPYDTVGNVECGAAYVYFKENGTWKQLVKLSASNASAGDEFGRSVSIYDDIIVIGAPLKAISGQSARGRVYVFKRFNRSWSQVVGLQASNGLTLDQFGTSVAIDGNMIVAGAPFTDYSGKTNAGSAYVFRFENNSWVQKKILNPSDPVNGAEFGSSVDISGHTVAAGAPRATVGATTFVGAVYTFNNIDLAGTNWVNGQKLLPDVIQAQMQFGHVVDIDQDRILAGAPAYDLPGAQNVGTAYQFTRTNGTWSSLLSLTSLVEWDRAGASVAMYDSYVFFGYPGYQDSEGRIMYASLLAGGGQKYFYDEDKDADRGFGSCMAVHNGQIIIGTSASNYNGRVFFGIID